MTEKENKKPARSKLDFSTKWLDDPKRIKKDMNTKSYTYVTVNSESNPEGFKFGRRITRVLNKSFNSDKPSEVYVFYPAQRVVFAENSVALNKLKNSLKGPGYTKANYKECNEFQSELENNVYDWNRLISIKDEIKASEFEILTPLSDQSMPEKESKPKKTKEKKEKVKKQKKVLPKSPDTKVKERN